MRFPLPKDRVIIECQNTTWHDAAAAALVNGRVYAISAERADRIKHSCDAYAAYEFLQRRAHQTFPALDCTYTPYREPHHHLGHAASAYYASPFPEALVLVLDGMGPYAYGTNISTSLWHGRGTTLGLLDSIAESGTCYRSAGHFYAAASYYLGFPFYDVSYTMSLAPYGDPSRYRASVATLIEPTPDGWFDTDRDFIRFATYLGFGQDFGWSEPPEWLRQQHARYVTLLGQPRRPGEPIEQRHKDLAAAVQERLEHILAHILQAIRARAPSIDTLCYAGGVALNCVANARVLPRSGFRSIYIQPAASDDGIALGRLLYRLYTQHGITQRVPMQQAYLGPPYARSDYEAALAHVARYIRAQRLTWPRLLEEVASRLARGQILAWYQGRSEFGPRALGHRSVLADPRNPAATQEISRKFKSREWFRPFAPSVLETHLSGYFHDHPSLHHPMRFMLAAVPARMRAHTAFAGALHIDGTARVQSVPDDRSSYSALLQAFCRQTGVPGLLNTSLNLPGSPIVETPLDALQLFMASRLDGLVLGPWLIERKSC